VPDPDWLRAALADGRATVTGRIRLPGPPAEASPAAFTRDVVDLARGLGWLCWHPIPLRTAKRWATGTQGDRGWPDVTACRGGRLVVAELKCGSGSLTPEQRAWLAELRTVGGGVEVYEWKPADWPAIVATFGGA